MSFQNTAPGAAAADQPAGEGPTAPVVSPVGHVTLVGAGPGDPELLTRKAYRALQTATLVLYDHLVGPAVLDCIAPGAERIYVGKESSRHTLPQEQIIELMVRLARSGRNVVRLKGGDGYIFGRGGEEVQALAEAGIGFDVVPGITALQALTAAHAMALNDINAPVLITTGRQLRERGWPESADPVAVMLDGQCAFQTLAPAGLHIWWGAYLGMPNQLCLSGALAEVGPKILRERAQARARHGWIMDTYLLKQVTDDERHHAD